MRHHYEGRGELAARRAAGLAGGIATLPEPVAALGTTVWEARLPVRVDTREQRPLDFFSNHVEVTRGTIPVFDYSLEGDENNFAVEYKNEDDFVQSLVMSDSLRRELQKIERARATWADKTLPIIYVVSSSFQDIFLYDFEIFSSGRVHPQFFFHQVSDFIFKHRVCVLFAGDRTGASFAVTLLLKRRAADIARQKKATILLDVSGAL